MSAKTGHFAKAESEPNPWIFQLYFYGTASVFGLVALTMIFSAFGDRRLLSSLEQKDVLFGFTLRTFLILAALFHLIGAVWLIKEQRLMIQAAIVLWVALNYFAYRIGVVLVNSDPPISAMQLIAWKIGFSKPALSLCWSIFIGYLAVGGSLILLIEYRKLGQLKRAKFEKQWRKQRSEEANSAVMSIHETVSPSQENKVITKPGRTIEQLKDTKHPPLATEFKFSCPRCGQHILCNEGYFDRFINCPSCKEVIKVPNPNLSRE